MGICSTDYDVASTLRLHLVDTSLCMPGSSHNDMQSAGPVEKLLYMVVMNVLVPHSTEVSDKR